VGALPDWLIPLPDAETMRETDRWAIEQQGVPSLELMEHAGAGVARAVERTVPEGAVAVVCGKGNNGGDGFVAARLLRELGREVIVVGVSRPDELSGDARETLSRLGDDLLVPLAEAALAGAAVIVDALLGTGFQGQPRGAVAEAIEAIDTSGAPVVSVDVPSGVDASTGVVAGIAVHATVTVTFHAAKPGLWIHPGKTYAGTVETIEIGIPTGGPIDLPASAGAGDAARGGEVTRPGGASVGLITPAVLGLLPRRDSSSTKFTSGHVLIVGGSRGLTGAPRMAAQASMRAGAGYVTACVPASLQAILASGGPPEMLTRGLSDDGDGLVPDGMSTALSAAERVGALALGPGLGRSDGAIEFARALAREANVAMVLDADGLNAHAGRLRELAARQRPTVLTPHAGELGRLLELDASAIERERLEHVRHAAELCRGVVALKGDDTLIADPSGRVAVSPGDSPGLATAGTGDVLTGVIAAILAQGLDPFAAAAAGVYLHAAAGREAARRQGVAEAVIASDVIAALPAARAAAAEVPASARDRRLGNDAGELEGTARA
jgi:ADP-dependent NAD(P)H-hydrate dehydratase / NAD(P)H-hydrate epimerase